jgi:hypothetical protein
MAVLSAITHSLRKTLRGLVAPHKTKARELMNNTMAFLFQQISQHLLNLLSVKIYTIILGLINSI